MVDYNVTGVASGEAFGVPGASGAASAAAVASAQAFGSPQAQAFVSSTGLPSGEDFGIAESQQSGGGEASAPGVSVGGVAHTHGFATRGPSLVFVTFDDQVLAWRLRPSGG